MIFRTRVPWPLDVVSGDRMPGRLVWPGVTNWAQDLGNGGAGVLAASL